MFTTMKSPINSVGIIEPDGILNGSIINDRIIKTARNTGKKDFAYSIKRRKNWFLWVKTVLSLTRLNNQFDKQTSPLMRVRENKITSKSKFTDFYPCPEPPRRPLVVFLRTLFASFSSCLLSVFPKVFFFEKCLHHNI